MKMIAKLGGHRVLNGQNKIATMRATINNESTITEVYYFSPFLWDIDKQADPDQMPRNAASDLGLHCLLTDSSFRILIKMKNTT